jgi:hypothetical protein
MNSATKRSLRRKVNLARRADLGDGALAHHHHAITKLHGLGLVVGDVDGGNAERSQQPIELAAQAITQCSVERGQRLVEQQDAGPNRHRARQCHPLALAAGQLIDPAAFQPADVGQRHQLLDARIAFCPAYTAQLQAIADVVGDAHVGKQRVGLEHHADIAPLNRDRRHVLAVEQHAPADVRCLEPGDDAQHGGLAAAGGAKQHQRLAAGDVEGGGFQCVGAVGKRLAAGLDPHSCAVTRLDLADGVSHVF